MVLVFEALLVVDVANLDAGFGVEVVPRRLVGIRVGVPSSLLISDKEEPCLEGGLEPPGVTLDLTGIEVFLDGVRRPMLSLSESAVVDTVLDLVNRSEVVCGEATRVRYTFWVNKEHKNEI